MNASPYSGELVIPPDATKIARATVSIELATIETIIAVRRRTVNRYRQNTVMIEACNSAINSAGIAIERM